MLTSLAVFTNMQKNKGQGNRLTRATVRASAAKRKLPFLDDEPDENGDGVTLTIGQASRKIPNTQDSSRMETESRNPEELEDMSQHLIIDEEVNHGQLVSAKDMNAPQASNKGVMLFGKMIPFNIMIKSSTTSSYDGNRPVSEPTIDENTPWNDSCACLDEKNILFTTNEKGVVMAIGKCYLLNEVTGDKVEPRFAVKDKRALKMGVSKFETKDGTGNYKLTLQLPLYTKHEADDQLLTNLMLFQGNVWRALSGSALLRDKLGWNLLQEEDILASPIAQDQSAFYGPGWYSIRIKWDKYKNGFEPGKLWNMTKTIPRRAKGAKGTSDGFYLNEETPNFSVYEVQKQHGIDGSFRVMTWWADSAGGWGLTASVASMRIFPKESFVSPLAMVISNSESESKESGTNAFVFNY